MSDELQRRVRALIDEASTAYAAGQLERTVELYRAADRLDPTQPTADLFIGTIYVELDRDRDAIDAFRAAIEREPDNDEAWRFLAEALDRTGDYTEANRAAATAEQLFIHNTIGRTADQARSAFERATDLEARALVVTDLVAIDDPRVQSLFHGLLETARDSDLERCSLTACSAIIDALIGLGVQEHAGIFSDGNAPDRPFIAENVDRYFRGVKEPPNRRPVWQLLARLFGR